MIAFIKGGGWLLILAAILTVWIGREVSSMRERAYLRGQAAQLAEQAEAGWATLQDSLEAWDAQKSTWQGAREALRADLDSTRQVATAAENSALRASQRVRDLLSRSADSGVDTTSGVISAAIDTLQRAVTACNASLQACDTLQVAAQARIWEVQRQVDQALALNRQQALTIERLQDVQGTSGGAFKYAGWILALGEAVYILVGH